MPTGVYPSEKRRGLFKKGNPSPKWMSGKKHSEKTRKKMSEAHKGNTHGFQKGYSFWQGKHHSEEHINKLAETHRGKHHSEEWKGKISKALRGEKNHQWKGGISFEPYPTDWIDSLKDSIRKRDNYTCQMCGVHQDELNGWYKKLDIHHIDYDKNNLDPINLISLCRNCHSKTNTNRNYWTNYFIKI